MSTPTDVSALSEHDSLSDSDWLDIASTDRDSDDNDSIFSSRATTDHEDLPRSRSRRSSVSYGSSREGDVDAWEGLIDDPVDEGVPNDVLTPDQHVPTLSQTHTTIDPSADQDTSLEELRVKEGLDQSMISTLSSSRSSSLHASTIHTSSRDLRLSFPDPITSSCRERELLSTSYEEVQHNPETLLPPFDSDGPTDAGQPDDDDDEMLSVSQTFSTDSLAPPVPSTSELKVFLYGTSTYLKWSVVDGLLQKVAHGAGLTITPNLADLHGPVRRLIVSGSFDRDHAFPRAITVLDRTMQLYDTLDDPALADVSDVRPLAIVFLPCTPLRLPERALRLPILVSPSHLSDDETTQNTWDLSGAPNHQVLRITGPDNSPILHEHSIDTIDPMIMYHAFARLWSSDNNTSKGIMAGTHALTIIAILSLILGVVVRAAILPSFQHQFISPTLTTLHSNYTNSLWQILRPAPYRERLPPSTTIDSSVLPAPSVFKEFSLTVFSAESTSITLTRSSPTNLRRVVSSTLSEHVIFSKDLMLQPHHSVLVPENRPKALSVVPDTSPTIHHRPSPVTTGHAVSVLMHTSTPDAAKESAPAAFAIMNHDMQEVFDAIDALVQAISRQTQIILQQATTFLEQSAMQLKSVESFEMLKGKLHEHNERARKRAKEIKEMGVRWLSDASEAITTGAEFSKGVAWEVAEGLAHRAQRARGKAKEMAADIQGLVNEYDGLEVLAWDIHAKHWGEWMERVTQGKRGQRCKSSRRKLESVMFG